MPLNLEHECLRGVYEQASDGIVVVDRRLRVIGLNPAAEMMSGWDAEEIVDKMTLGDLLLCSDGDGTRLEEFSLPPPEIVPPKGGWTREVEITVLRKDGQHFWAPGVFIFSTGSGEAGPYGFLLMRDVEKRVLQSEMIEKERIDSLSGVYTRSFFDELFEKEARRALRHGGFLGVVVIEFQNLGTITDSQNSSGAESAIRVLGQLIRTSTREVDLPARLGFGEFAILLLDSDIAKTARVGQRVREKIELLNSSSHFSQPLKYRIGTAVSDHGYDALLKRAQDALK